MGKLEKELRADVRRTKINNAILTTLIIAGAMAIGAVPPNVFSLLGKVKYRRQRKYQIQSSLSRLIEKGYVSVDRKGGDAQVRLTEKGELFAALLNDGSFPAKKQKRWDKKWRLLIFDIPERRRGAREKVRTMLRSLGFLRLQDSVWAYPYDCEDLITLLKVDMRIGKDLLYIIADKIEMDGALRKHFHLT